MKWGEGWCRGGKENRLTQPLAEERSERGSGHLSLDFERKEKRKKISFAGGGKLRAQVNQRVDAEGHL